MDEANPRLNENQGFNGKNCSYKEGEVTLDQIHEGASNDIELCSDVSFLRGEESDISLLSLSTENFPHYFSDQNLISEK